MDFKVHHTSQCWMTPPLNTFDSITYSITHGSWFLHIVRIAGGDLFEHRTGVVTGEAPQCGWHLAGVLLYSIWWVSWSCSSMAEKEWARTWKNLGISTFFSIKCDIINTLYDINKMFG